MPRRALSWTRCGSARTVGLPTSPATPNRCLVSSSWRSSRCRKPGRPTPPSMRTPYRRHPLRISAERAPPMGPRPRPSSSSLPRTRTCRRVAAPQRVARASAGTSRRSRSSRSWRSRSAGSAASGPRSAPRAPPRPKRLLPRTACCLSRAGGSSCPCRSMRSPERSSMSPTEPTSPASRSAGTWRGRSRSATTTAGSCGSVPLRARAAPSTASCWRRTPTRSVAASRGSGARTASCSSRCPPIGSPRRTGPTG